MHDVCRVQLTTLRDVAHNILNYFKFTERIHHLICMHVGVLLKARYYFKGLGQGCTSKRRNYGFKQMNVQV